MPAALQESLSSGVNALVATTPTCLPPVETATPAPSDHGDEGNGHGYGRKKHKHGDHNQNEGD